MPALSPFPPIPTGTTPEVYNAESDAYFGHLVSPFEAEMNAAVSTVNVASANALSAVAALANSAWSSGSYTAGDVVYSPIDFLNYRAKTTGSLTTDPSLDSTNWVLLTKTESGGASTTSGSSDIALTFSSESLQNIAMTATGKKVTLPDATSLTVGKSLFVITNTGNYSFAVRDNGGRFLADIEPSQTILLHCSSSATSSGVWFITGDKVSRTYGSNTEEVLNSDSVSYLSIARLNSTQAIVAYSGASSRLNVVVVDSSGSSGTPVEVNAESSTYISIASLTSTKAVVVYTDPSLHTNGYVIDVAGLVPTPGSVKQIDGTAGGSGATLTSLSSTKCLCVYLTAANNTPRERVLDISGTTITESSEVVADANTSQSLMNVEAITSTKALIAFRGASGGGPLRLRLQSITVSTPAPVGTTLTLLSDTPGSSSFGLIALDSNYVLMAQDNSGSGNEVGRLYVYLIDVSGTTPVVVHQISFTGSSSNSQSTPYLTKLSSSKALLTWTGGIGAWLQGVRVSISSDEKIIINESPNLLVRTTHNTQFIQGGSMMDENNALLIFKNSSNFAASRKVEITP